MTKAKLRKLLESSVSYIKKQDTGKEYLHLEQAEDFDNIIYRLNSFLNASGINLTFFDVREDCESYYEARTYVDLFTDDNGAVESGYYVFDSDAYLVLDSYDDFLDGLLGYINKAEYIQDKLNQQKK